MKRAALIGLGMVADTHLAAIADATGVTLAGVLARSPEKTRAFAEKAEAVLGQPVAAWSDLSEITGKGAVDLAILATPPDARVVYVSALAAARIPILMEKPVERTLEAARQIVDLCNTSSLPLGIVFQHRARAASRALKAKIDAGKMGRIISAEVRVPWWRDQSYYDVPGRGTRARDGGGVMLTQAIHTLDLALWMLGPIRRLTALMHQTPIHRLETEDWAGALFETAGGAVGTIFASTAAYPGQPESLSLHGTEASAHLEAGVLTLQNWDGSVEVEGETAATGGGADPMAFTHAWHQDVLQDFVDCLDSVRTPLATGSDGINAHAVIDAMERSSETREWVEVQSA